MRILARSKGADASRPLTSNYNADVTLIIRDKRRDRGQAGFLFIRDSLDWTIKAAFFDAQ